MRAPATPVLFWDGQYIGARSRRIDRCGVPAEYPAEAIGLVESLCYVCACMAETTTIRLPPKLRARLRAIAKETDRSVHSLILEAVEKHAAYEEQMRSLVKEALAADAEVERTGEVAGADDVHAWARRIAQGVASPRPRPWRK
jgi:predicted transcriptional regulator